MTLDPLGIDPGLDGPLSEEEWRCLFAVAKLTAEGKRVTEEAAIQATWEIRDVPLAQLREQVKQYVRNN